MKLEFESIEAAKDALDANFEVYLATFNKEDDRLIFKIFDKIALIMNLREKDNQFILQVPQCPDNYTNWKKVSRLELRAIIEG